MHKSLLLICGLLCGPLAAADMNIELEIPRLNVSEYHRPYVAIWLEQEQRHAGDIAVWYDLKMANREGESWLKDLRMWWRRSGRTLEMPVDGITGATRHPGAHQVALDASKAPLKDLQPGDYELVVEAAREVGGRELLRLAFTWPATSATTVSAQGEHELGKITLSLAP